MAFAPFTGKSATTAATYNAVTLPGWREITIEENGKPIPEPLDITDAGDSAYTFVDDPPGGKGANNARVTITGLLSVTDHEDGAAGWLQFAPGASHALIITTKTGGDMYTLANAVLKSFNTDVEVAGVVPYTAVFSNATSAGVWSTQGA